MPGLIGKKIGMTSTFKEGKNIACTILEVGPCFVTQIKTLEKDGYNSIQLGFDSKKEKNTTKPLLGHFKKSDLKPKKRLVEFKSFNQDLKVGQSLSVDSLFKEGDCISVSAISKGKGFQGVVKRHGFKGVGEATHGQHNRQRHPGSIGGCSDPSRVWKGTKMAGRMGNKKVSIKKITYLKNLSK